MAKKKRAAKITQPVAETAAPRRRKKKLPCDLDVDFLEEVKDGVVFLQTGPAPNTSIRSFVEDALRAALKAVKRKHRNLLPKNGEIPSRKSVRPRPGRPMS